VSRVSENSSIHAIKHSVGKTKSKVEDLQIKGSNMKRIQKPSDDPIGNVDLLQIRSKNIDAQQYLRNLSFAQTNLGFTETVLEELTDILTKAKELAIGQSSDIYNPEVRKSVSK
jgi:flagellar hook-associated protein 3 FlgL